MHIFHFNAIQHIKGDDMLVRVWLLDLLQLRRLSAARYNIEYDRILFHTISCNQ